MYSLRTEGVLEYVRVQNSSILLCYLDKISSFRVERVYVQLFLLTVHTRSTAY
jgi:hypothetical protein